MRTNMTHKFALLATSATLFVAFSATPGDKIAKELKKLAKTDSTDVIVVRKPVTRRVTIPGLSTAGLAAPAIVPISAAMSNLLANGGAVRASFDAVKQSLVRGKWKDVERLADDDDVVAIVPNRPLKPTLALAYQTTGAYVAPSFGLTGAGVAVAVIDSGVTLHPDLKDATCTTSRIVYSESFIPGVASAADGFGHGTHVAGIVAGNGACSGASSQPPMKGIAPAAKIVNLRVLDNNGNGSDADVIAAINRAIQLRDSYNIRVINLSLGRPIFESYTMDALCQAVEAATTAGILVVTSAGNLGQYNGNGVNGYGTIKSPGNDPFALTVGAVNMKETTTRADDVVASYSSKGPSALNQIVKPDLVAPGNRIGSALATGTTIANTYASLIVTTGYPANKYIRLSGTSMAAPMAAGAAALLVQREPGLTPGQVKSRLMRTASKAFPASSTVTNTNGTFTTYHDTPTIGAGQLDIAAALTQTGGTTEGAISPKLVINNWGGVSITDTTTTWANPAVNWALHGPVLYGAVNVSSTAMLGNIGTPLGRPFHQRLQHPLGRIHPLGRVHPLGRLRSHRRPLAPANLPDQRAGLKKGLCSADNTYRWVPVSTMARHPIRQ
jgi:subtilisin family serine protease